MQTFGKIEEKYSGLPDSEILLQSLPYDGASTWGKGADKGFEAFLEASNHLELYDIETGSEVYRKGLHILPEIKLKGSDEEVSGIIYDHTRDLLRYDKLLTFIGGDHSISIGILKAFREQYDDLTVLQLDAHTDLRPEYQGSKYNHACAMHEASKKSRLVQAGIRSMDSSELEFFNPSNCILASEMYESDRWKAGIRNMLKGRKVYISVDMDVFDPSVFPHTGTPEPGGLTWYQVISLLREAFSVSDVLGFDLVEFAPLSNNKAPAFTMVKLYYKMLSYKYYTDGRNK